MFIKVRWKIERAREAVARRLIWLAKVINPGLGRMYDAHRGWFVDFEWEQPTNKDDKGGP